MDYYINVLIFDSISPIIQSPVLTGNISHLSMVTEYRKSPESEIL